MVVFVCLLEYASERFFEEKDLYKNTRVNQKHFDNFAVRRKKKKIFCKRIALFFLKINLFEKHCQILSCLLRFEEGTPLN